MGTGGRSRIGRGVVGFGMTWGSKRLAAAGYASLELVASGRLNLGVIGAPMLFEAMGMDTIV